MWDVLSGVAKMAWDIMSGMTKNSMGCYVQGEKKHHGMFCPGWQIFVGCFVRGVIKWHGMFCPAPVWSSFPWVESRHTNCSHCLFEHTRKIFGPYLNQ